MLRAALGLVLSLFVVSATPDAQRATAPAVPPVVSALPNQKDSVKFLVIGDSGSGDRYQYETAASIVEARKRFPFEFSIMLGDNLYGNQSPADYQKKFAAPYKPLLDNGVKFYASLGNHDDPSQRFYEPFNMDGKRYYNFRKKHVEFYALDSTYMTPQQIEWLHRELGRSDSAWKISYFHHPIYSSGNRHGSELDLQTLVEPLFLKYGVNVVFAGHEHFYERLKPQKGILYITQGGASKLRRGNIKRNSVMTAKGFDTDRSFTLIEIDGDQMFFETVSRMGQIVDSGVFTRQATAASTQ
jgi:hypothetical protein